MHVVARTVSDCCINIEFIDVHGLDPGVCRAVLRAQEEAAYSKLPYRSPDYIAIVDVERWFVEHCPLQTTEVAYRFRPTYWCKWPQGAPILATTPIDVIDPIKSLHRAEMCEIIDFMLQYHAETKELKQCDLDSLHFLGAYFSHQD
jgi:hypothetical protein